MSTAEMAEWADVLSRVTAWPLARRIALAKRILDSVPVSDLPASPTLRGVSAAELRRLLATGRPAPDDETIKQWIDEHRTEKYGR